MSIDIFQMNGINPRGSSNVGGDVAPPGTLACTPEQVATFGASGARFPGTTDFQFEYDGTTLTQLTDTRPIATWSLVSGDGVLVDGDLEFELGVGAAEPIVKVTLSVPFTNPKELVKFGPSGHLLSLNVVNGEAELAIKTDKPTKYELNISKKARFANTLRVWIRAVDLYTL